MEIASRLVPDGRVELRVRLSLEYPQTQPARAEEGEATPSEPVTICKIVGDEPFEFSFAEAGREYRFCILARALPDQ
jgi:hypothetical protein